MAKAQVLGFSAENRNEHINAMKSQIFDLVIVGGGINGAGIARDAASRGLKVAVIEADDFASGTSSRSSKLIHGGIRYLENLEFGLVFEALSERTLLFEIAPLLVHPLRFVLPVYKHSRVHPSVMSLGMWLYDALALFNVPMMHERLSLDETLERLPMLQTKDLKCSFVYSDAYMDDDRLTLETLRSAVEKGAVAANYCKVTGANQVDGKVNSLKVQDLESGQNFEVKGHHFVGGVGPWTDIFGQSVFPGHWKNKLRPTKGVHLTLSRDRLPLKEAVVMMDDRKNRIIFGIPRHEMIIIGTTDTDFPGDPGKVSTSREDVDYLLSMCKEYFPGAKVTEEDILASYSGVRPLVKDGSATEGKTSREHEIWYDDRNITFVAGGKYTTYRLIAEQVVDQTLSHLPHETVSRLKPSLTKESLNAMQSASALQKAESLIDSWSKTSGLSQESVANLVKRYGLEVEKYCFDPKSLSEVDVDLSYAIENTMCLHLKDFYLRRTHLFLAQKDNGFDSLDEIAFKMAVRLGWNSEQTKNEVQMIKDHFASEMSWRV